MPKRTVLINSPAKLSAEHGSLSVLCEGTRALVPLEDIWVLIIESRQALVTGACLSELCENGIGTMICGRTHMPAGLALPLGAHSRHSAIVENQLLMSKPLKKRLWQRTVKAKISNQAKVLELMGLPDEADALSRYAKAVRSGDPDGREAVAAAAYFRALAPDGGRRESRLTPLLDYGYAVLRAGIARELVSGGWLVSRGIHHESSLNAFNLADDLIEPFRPAIDLLVSKELDGSDLGPASKQSLARAGELVMTIGGEELALQDAMRETIASFGRAVRSDDAGQLALPQLERLSCWDGGKG